MSEVGVDAYVTARCLLVQLLLADQHAGEEHEPPHRRGPSLTPPPAETINIDSDGNIDTAGGAATPREDGTTATVTREKKKTSETSAHGRGSCASPTTKKSWWKRRRAQLPSVFKARGSTPKGNTHPCSTSVSKAGRSSSVTFAVDHEPHLDVLKWQSSVNASLRERSAELERCLRVLHRRHTASALRVGLSSLLTSLSAESTTDAASSSIDNETSAAAAAAGPSASEDALHKHGEAASSTSAVVPSDALADFSAHLRVVSTGYAATLYVQQTRSPRADCSEGAATPARAAREPSGGNTDKSPLTTPQSAASAHPPTSTFNGRKNEKAPLTLQEQLGECLVRMHAADEGEGPGGARANPRSHLRYREEKLLSLLAQLQHVQSTVSAAQQPSANPLWSPSTPTSARPERATSSNFADALPVDDAPVVAQCTVWESTPLCTSAAPSAALSAYQKEARTSRGREGSGAPAGKRSARGAMERFTSMWQHDDKSRRCSSTVEDEEPAATPSTEKKKASEKSGKAGKAPTVSATVAQGGGVWAADPLCGTSDGDWSLTQASIRSTHDLYAKVSRMLGQDACDLSPLLCAHCPLLPSPKCTSGARARVIASYALPSRELTGVPCVNSSADPADVKSISSIEKVAHTLMVQTTWSVCAEVDAADAAWLQSTLLNVTTSSPTTAEDADGSVAQIRTVVMAALTSLADAGLQL